MQVVAQSEINKLLNLNSGKMTLNTDLRFNLPIIQLFLDCENCGIHFIASRTKYTITALVRF